MNRTMRRMRRTVLQASGALGVLALGGALGRQAAAADWNKTAFESKNMPDALKNIGIAAPTESKDIVIKAPDIAENGAVVPVEITSKVPGTRSIIILAEKNPQPMVANFTLAEGVEGYISTRIKMGETANIKVFVNAGGKYFTAAKEVKVTIGGCG
jgi:sulfur-oxidizing protein SoxY